MKHFLTSLLLTTLLCACTNAGSSNTSNSYNYSVGNEADKQLDQRRRENDRSGYDKPDDPLMRE